MAMKKRIQVFPGFFFVCKNSVLLIKRLHFCYNSYGAFIPIIFLGGDTMNWVKQLLAPPPAQPLRDDATVRRLYPRYRVRVFIGIFVGYMGYYFVRNTTAVLSGILQMSATQIGIISCASYVAYGISKFVSGHIADSSNAKIFLPLGLVLSGVVNILIGVIPGIISTVWIFTVMYLINGWLQGMGYGPCSRTLVYWFDDEERTLWGSIWNLAHNFGGALAPALAGLGLAIAGNNAMARAHAAYWLPGIVVIIIAVFVYFIQEDTPESVGMPSVEQYHHLPAKKQPAAVPPMKVVIREYILPNKKLLWACMYGAFVYVLRYGIVVWAPRFLAAPQSVGGKAVNAAAGMGGFSFFEIGGVLGMLCAMVICRKVFNNSMPLTNVAFLVLTMVLVVIYWFIPAGNQYLLADYAVLIGLGFGIYGPVMTIGLYAMGIVPKIAAGAAAGLSGTFSYVLGAVIATLVIGIIADHMGWLAVFGLFIIAAIGAIICTLLSRDKRLEGFHQSQES